MSETLQAGRYVVAVSGGVDSVVLLDKLAQQPGIELIVAHFDHGIREDSAEDAQFVAELAKKYRLPFETRREELGSTVSEERARTRRYAFLRKVASAHQAKIVTAHHGDDVVETIVINLTRGTGWRGLAVLDSDIVRPLLGHTKQELLDYAEEHSLNWHEDSTNASNVYLRNRIRRKLATGVSDDVKWQLRALCAQQVAVKHEIDAEVGRLLKGKAAYSRYFFTAIDERVADELLRAVFERATTVSPTRPQRHRALLLIKTARAGTTHQIGAGTKLVIQKRTFTVR